MTTNERELARDLREFSQDLARDIERTLAEIARERARIHRRLCGLDRAEAEGRKSLRVLAPYLRPAA